MPVLVSVSETDGLTARLNPCRPLIQMLIIDPSIFNQAETDTGTSYTCRTVNGLPD